MKGSAYHAQPSVNAGLARKGRDWSPLATVGGAANVMTCPLGLGSGKTAARDGRS
jgi:hypothetical protein